MQNQTSNSVYEIATISSKEQQAIKKAEDDLKKSTGKEFVVIAWEKK
jgi:hypothetical protein